MVHQWLTKAEGDLRVAMAAAEAAARVAWAAVARVAAAGVHAANAVASRDPGLDPDRPASRRAVEIASAAITAAPQRLGAEGVQGA